MADYEAAALRDPVFRFIHSISSSIGEPPNQIAHFREQAAAARAKAESLTDRKWRRAYLGWCDYADRNIDKAEKAWAERGKRSEAYEADRRRREEEIARLLADNPPR